MSASRLHGDRGQVLAYLRSALADVTAATVLLRQYERDVPAGSLFGAVLRSDTWQIKEKLESILRGMED